MSNQFGRYHPMNINDTTVNGINNSHLFEVDAADIRPEAPKRGRSLNGKRFGNSGKTQYFFVKPLYISSRSKWRFVKMRNDMKQFFYVGFGIRRIKNPISHNRTISCISTP